MPGTWTNASAPSTIGVLENSDNPSVFEFDGPTYIETATNP